MLDLRPNCECCDKDLPPEAADALICTFECAFCADCVEHVLDGVCPNCGGNFFGPADPSRRDAEKISGFDQARPQGRGLRPAQSRVNTVTLETEGK